MPMEEIKGALAIDGVAALKELDLGAVGETELSIKMAHFGIFVGDPRVDRNAVVVASLDHEGAGEDEVGHFGVVEGVAEIPVGHFPFDRLHEGAGIVDGGDFAGPLIEIAGTNDDGVVLDHWRNPHGGLAAVAESVEGDAFGIDIWLRL